MGKGKSVNGSMKAMDVSIENGVRVVGRFNPIGAIANIHSSDRLGAVDLFERRFPRVRIDRSRDLDGLCILCVRFGLKYGAEFL